MVNAQMCSQAKVMKVSEVSFSQASLVYVKLTKET